MQRHNLDGNLFDYTWKQNRLSKDKEALKNSVLNVIRKRPKLAGDAPQTNAQVSSDTLLIKLTHFIYSEPSCAAEQCSSSPGWQHARSRRRIWSWRPREPRSCHGETIITEQQTRKWIQKGSAGNFEQVNLLESPLKADLFLQAARKARNWLKLGPCEVTGRRGQNCKDRIFI